MNYFYIQNNQNKLLNQYNKKKYYKVGDMIDLLPAKISGDSTCINVLNGYVRNYVTNLLLPIPPKTYRPRLINDALLFSGMVQVYNHDIVMVGLNQYELAEEFLITINTDNNSTILDYKYIKGLKGLI